MTILKKGSRGEEVKILQKALNLYPDGIFGILTEEAVKEFQKIKGLEVDGIVGSKTWGYLELPNPRNIKEIIIHCSATPEGEDYTTTQIRQWHLQRGFSDIGYHYVIYRDGTIAKGRDEAISGAHCTNHNSVSIGVCYIGGCPDRSDENWQNKGKDTRTHAQKESLKKLLNELKAKYPGATIYGHRNFAVKSCPSFDAKEEYRNL